MKKNSKLIYNQIDVVLQSLLVIAFGISLLMGSIDREWEMVSVVVFFTFAAVQLFGSLFLGFQFDDKRRKLYLKAFLFVQVIGSFLMALIFQIEEEVGFLLFGLIWVVAPFFMAIWCYVNSWLAIKEAKKIIVSNNDILDEEMTRNTEI